MGGTEESRGFRKCAGSSRIRLDKWRTEGCQRPALGKPGSPSRSPGHRAGDAARAKNYPALAGCQAWVLGAEARTRAPGLLPNPHPRASAKVTSALPTGSWPLSLIDLMTQFPPRRGLGAEHSRGMAGRPPSWTWRPRETEQPELGLGTEQAWGGGPGRAPWAPEQGLPLAPARCPDARGGADLTLPLHQAQPNCHFPRARRPDTGGHRGHSGRSPAETRCKTPPPAEPARPASRIPEAGRQSYSATDGHVLSGSEN